MYVSHWYHKLQIGLALSLTTLATTTYALSTDREQPINIVADSATIDDAKGIAIYEGNVVVTQGTILIHANKLTLTYTNKQSLKQAIAEGNPATFQQTPDNKKGEIHATANRMEYQAEDDRLNLTKDAKVWQDKDSFTGAKISYDTKDGVIRAEKGSDKDSARVSVTIQPAKTK